MRDENRKEQPEVREELATEGSVVIRWINAIPKEQEMYGEHL